MLIICASIIINDLIIWRCVVISVGMCRCPGTWNFEYLEMCNICQYLSIFANICQYLLIYFQYLLLPKRCLFVVPSIDTFHCYWINVKIETSIIFRCKEFPRCLDLLKYIDRCKFAMNFYLSHIIDDASDT